MIYMVNKTLFPSTMEVLLDPGLLYTSTRTLADNRSAKGFPRIGTVLLQTC